MTDLATTTRILADLIALPSVSADSNLGVIDYIAERLKNVGARVEILPGKSGTKANLFATLGPAGDGGIILSGHTDVVPVADQNWATDPFEMVEKDGRLYGRGTCDMKGFIAATLAMAPEYAKHAIDRPLHFAFTHDEELGCIGGKRLVQELISRGLKPSIAIIGEPTEMRIVDGHKGCREYTARITGLEGHGSTPDRGVNAAEFAVRYVMHLLELREQLIQRTPAKSQFSPPWTTLNVGKITGGVAHNVIAGKAEVDWEMRPVQISDAVFVDDAMNKYCTEELLPAMQAVHQDAAIDVDIVGDVVGFHPAKENEAAEIVAELTGQNTRELAPFCTEAGLFQSLGTSVVICGPGSIEQAHMPDEFISLEQLDQCLTMLIRLAAKLQT